jgi:hypothetical protein
MATTTKFVVGSKFDISSSNMTDGNSTNDCWHFGDDKNQTEQTPIETTVECQETIRHEGVRNNFIGCVVAITASVIGNVGMNVEKQAHVNNERLHLSQQRPYYTQPLWWLGQMGVILGSFGDLAALGFATQSLVVAAGGATTLVSNCLIARFWHHDELDNLSIFGVLSIMCGSILFAVYAPPAQYYELETLEKHFHSVYFLGYIGALGGVTFLLLSHIATKTVSHKIVEKAKTKLGVAPAIVKVDKLQQKVTELERQVQQMMQQQASERVEEEDGKENRRSTSAISWSGDKKQGGGEELCADSRGRAGGAIIEENGRGTMGSSIGMLVLIDPPSKSEANRIEGSGVGRTQGRGEWADGTGGAGAGTSASGTKWFDAYIYAMCAGMVGSLSVLLASCAMKTLFLLFKGMNEFVHPTPYGFIIGMITTVLIQTHLLNRALQLGEVLTVFPLFQAFWIGFGIVGGMVFFQQTHELQMGDWIVHGCAGVFMLVGCVCLAEHGRLAFMLGVVQQRIGRSSSFANSRSNTPNLGLNSTQGSIVHQAGKRTPTLNALHSSADSHVVVVNDAEMAKDATGGSFHTYSYSASPDMGETPAEQVSFTPIASV